MVEAEEAEDGVGAEAETGLEVWVEVGEATSERGIGR